MNGATDLEEGCLYVAQTEGVEHQTDDVHCNDREQLLSDIEL